jgi:chemotaxis protein MotB
MGFMRKQPEPEEPAGAPEWMVTYCDCMTLMLTFFVLLFSFASLDKNVIAELSTAFAEAMSTVKKDKSAFLPTKQILATEYLDEGGEKPTLVKELEDNLTEDTESANFRDRKVFLFSSKRLFWGKGMVISSEGRNALSKMASFLKEIPCRIVISENGPGDDGDSKQFGLLRAWAVMEYLTTKQGLDKGRFSLAADTLQRGHKNSQQDHSQVKVGRTLEIILLERSIYN